MHTHDVFGIGHALVDLLVEVSDDKLKKLNLNKGQFHLVSKKQAETVLKTLKNLSIKKAPGGSCANTITAVAHMGGDAVLCGKVGYDSHGDFYIDELNYSNVHTNIKKYPLSTGFCITFITPDSERTFVVYYGAATKLKKKDLAHEKLKNSRFLHIEGYALYGESKDAVLHAISAANKYNVDVSLDLGDPGLVDNNKEFLAKLIKENVDIVFANEDEAAALTDLPAEEALHEIGKLCKLAIVKLGKKGSIMKIRNKVIKVAPISADAVDTTGAGDMYAAGVLYAIANNLSLEEAGKIGSFAAAKIVEVIGARLDSSLKDSVNEIL